MKLLDPHVFQPDKICLPNRTNWSYDRSHLHVVSEECIARLQWYNQQHALMCTGLLRLSQMNTNDFVVRCTGRPCCLGAPFSNGPGFRINKSPIVELKTKGGKRLVVAWYIVELVYTMLSYGSLQARVMKILRLLNIQVRKQTISVIARMTWKVIEEVYIDFRNEANAAFHGIKGADGNSTGNFNICTDVGFSSARDARSGCNSSFAIEIKDNVDENGKTTRKVTAQAFSTYNAQRKQHEAATQIEHRALKEEFAAWESWQKLPAIMSHDACNKAGKTAASHGVEEQRVS